MWIALGNFGRGKSRLAKVREYGVHDNRNVGGEMLRVADELLRY